MKIALLLLLSGIAVTPMFAKPPADIQTRLDDWIKGQPGGVAVAWVDADGATYFQSGQFDITDPHPITPDTQFELGSVTKVFTALLLAESERLGKVSRHDPAAKFLLPPGDPDQATLARITLLTLTTHTSGLPRLSSNIGPNPDANADPYAKYDRAMLIEALRKDGKVAPAGRSVAYSNFGAAVLGEALAAAWGGSYAGVLRERVILPLGMKATTLGMAGATPPADFPPGHVGGKAVPNWTFQAYAPAGALRSSARDMAVFLQAYLHQESSPLGPALVATLQPQAEADVGGHICLGWFVTDEGIFWHNGATVGSHAFVAFNPKSGVGVALLANVQLGSEALGFSLLDAKPPQQKRETVPDATGYIGRYPLTPAFAIDITNANGVLRGQATGQPAFAMKLISPDRFSIVGVPAEISFERGAEGKVEALVLHQNGRDVRGLRGELPPPPPTVTLPAATLAEYAGSYPIVPAFVLTVTVENGAVFVQATGQTKLPVFASAKDEFFYTVMDARISFQRDAGDKVTGLILHQNGRDMPATKTK